MTLFKKLINTYFNAFVYLWYHPKVGMWMGATPETLLKVEGDKFKTVALAGTQLFKGDMEVEWGDKEIEEQQMVVNSIVEKLKEETDELKVSEKFTVKAGNLLHLQTNISGTIHNLETSNNQNEIKKLINALHPTAAVCGLPKDKAKQFILNNENYDREFYTGFLGELNISDYNLGKSEEETLNIVSNIYVNLRCMKIVKNKAIIYVGGGITKDSNVENEWEETVNKTKVIKKVLF
jgi:isochorismate synthase